MTKIKDLMTQNPKTVSMDTPVHEVAMLMRDLDVGALPVANGGGVAGIITDRDVTVRVVAEGMDPMTTLVRECMTEEVIVCKADSDINEALKLMEQHQIRRIPVVDGDRHLVGVVSIGDVAKSESEKTSGHVLKEVSKS
jgi:CBS domain-containing protein